MGIVGLTVLGLLAGYLAHLVLPRREGTGATGTAVAGMAGSLLGGLAGSLLAAEGLQLGTAGLLGSVVGVVSAVLVATRRRRTTRTGAHHA